MIRLLTRLPWSRRRRLAPLPGAEQFTRAHVNDYKALPMRHRVSHLSQAWPDAVPAHSSTIHLNQRDRPSKMHCLLRKRESQ